MTENIDSRTAHGLVALRKRFVRRAEFLAQDLGYRRKIADARKWWNEHYPTYWVQRVDSDSDYRAKPPQALLDDIEREEREEREYLHPDEGEWSLAHRPSSGVQVTWNRMVASLADQFWPRQDFPHPNRPDHHPARAFITASLYRDPRTLQADVDSLIAAFTLLPEPMLATRSERELDELLDDEWVEWCIPLYPGVTAKDLQEAAPLIAERVNQVFRSVTPEARILALHNQDLTQKAIAARLGLTEKTVQATLREHRRTP